MTHEIESSITILVVDDEPVVRTILERALLREGFHTMTASDGVEALEKLRGSTIDVVITDVLMPRMDGLELLVEVKSQFPEVPVIMITGYSDQFSGKQALEAGAEDFIVKPFKNQDIRYALQRTIVRVQLSRAKKRVLK